MRDPIQLANAAQAMHEIISAAKVLGVTEIGHQIDPENITKEDILGTEAVLKDKISAYTRKYLSLTTTDVLMNYKDLMGLDPDKELAGH